MSKFPARLGQCVDLAYKMRRERLGVQARVDEMKKREGELEKYVLDNFTKGDIEGASGRLATASIGRRTVAHIKDWTKFMDWVRAERAYDMLKRDVNDKAYRSRLDADEEVPGLEPFQIVKLHVSKRGQ